MEIAERLEALRLERGWSKVELAKRTALNYQHVCKVLAGDRKRLEVETLKAFARAFKITTDYLIGMEDDEKSDMEPTAVALVGA